MPKRFATNPAADVTPDTLKHRERATLQRMRQECIAWIVRSPNEKSKRHLDASLEEINRALAARVQQDDVNNMSNGAGKQGVCPFAKLRVGDALEVEVKVEVGRFVWAPFRAFEVSADHVSLVKCDEPDFFVDIVREEGKALTLPADMRPLPHGAPPPAENGAVVWAVCFRHLKSPERLGVSELRLPGPGGYYTVFEEKRELSDKIVWLKRVRAPSGQVYKTLEKLAKALFSGELLRLATDSPRRSMTRSERRRSGKKSSSESEL